MTAPLDPADLARLQQLLGEFEQLPEGSMHRDRACLALTREMFKHRAQLLALAAQGPQWRDMNTAPMNASWVLVQLEDGDVRRAHWASDLSGSDQPAFHGWFVKSGNSFVELPSQPKRWMPLPAPEKEPRT